MNYGPNPSAAARTAQTAEPNGRGILDEVVQATSAHRFSISEMEKIAQKAASSRMFGGGEDGGAAMSPDQAFMMCLIAEATGIHPALALLRYDIVMGKPAMKSAFVLAEFQRLGGVVDWVESTEERVKATFTSKRHPRPFTIELTLQQLKDRKVATKYDKESKTWKLKHMYANHPRSMLRWRAAVEAIRATDPGIFMGMYADCEAEDIDATASAANEAETTARASLVEKLAGRRESPKESHPPVAETAAALKEAPKPEPAREPESEWVKMVAGAVLEFNQALAELAEANPSNLALRKAMTTQQAVNGLVKALVAEGLSEDALKTDGKRDAAKVRRALDDIWANDSELLEGTVARYLGSKMTELMGPVAAPAQGELAMA
jgi:hypothetical protein